MREDGIACRSQRGQFLSAEASIKMQNLVWWPVSRFYPGGEPKRNSTLCLTNKNASRKRKVTLCQYALSVAIILSSNIVNAQNLPELVFQPGDSIDKILSRFEERIQSIIASAGQEARAVAVTFYNLAGLLTADLRRAYHGEMTATFSELSDQRGRAVADLRNLLNRMNDGLSARTAQFQEGIEELTTSLDNLSTLVKTQPMVTRIEPPSLSKSAHGQDQLVTVHGRQLAYGKATLAFAGRTIPASGRQDNQLQFLVPAAVIPDANDGPTWIKASLVVPEQPTVGFGNDSEFDLLFLSLPEYIATFNLSVKRSIVDNQSRERCFPPADGVPLSECRDARGRPIYRRAQDFLVTGPSMKEAKPKGQNNTEFMCVYPSDGWEFDIRHVAVKTSLMLASRSNSRCHENSTGCAPDENKGAVMLDETRGGARPERICISSQARPMNRKARAWTGAQVWAREIRTVTDEQWNNIAPLDRSKGTLGWDSTLVYELPPNIGWELSFVDFAGRRDSLSAAEQAKFFSVSYQPDTRRLYVRPKHSTAD